MLCVWILLFFFEKFFIRLIDFWLFLFLFRRRRERWWCWDTYFEGSCVVFIFFVKVIPRHSTRTHNNDDDSLRYLLIVAWAASEATAPFHALVCRSETTTFAAESNQTISNPSRENQVKIIKTFSLFFSLHFSQPKNKWWEMIRKTCWKGRFCGGVRGGDPCIFIHISILCVHRLALSLSLLFGVCVYDPPRLAWLN